MVESQVKAVAEQYHIDYQFIDLEDDGSDYDDDDDDDNCYSYDGSDDGELSFDYQKNFQEQDVIHTSRKSIKVKSSGFVLCYF